MLWLPVPHMKAGLTFPTDGDWVIELPFLKH